jgi:NADH:ubiquinone oxidoreductase subunit E
MAVAETGGAAVAGTIDFQPLDAILEEFRGRRDAVIPILQRAQDVYGYLPREVLYYISKKTRIAVSRLYGVATFYAQFRLTRRGKHLIRMCDGTACHVRGAKKSLDAIEKSMHLQPGQTSPDLKYTLEIVYCLGSCGLAPVALVNDKVMGRLNPDALVKRLGQLE